MSTICPKCEREVTQYAMTRSGVCQDCADAERDAAIKREREKEGARHARGNPIIVTTPTVPGREIVEPLGIVSAQVAFGMNALKDIATAWRDVVGGRANSLQGILADSRKQVLVDLANEAIALDADAVVGVDIDMSEFSAGGGMVMMIATGTAVRLAAPAAASVEALP